MLVGVDAGRVIGFTSFLPRFEGGVEVDDLFVDPRWQRRGIGRMLVTALAEHIRPAPGIRYVGDSRRRRRDSSA